MSNAPVCHISTNQQVTDQPKPTLLPFVPAAVDLPSALAAITALRLIVQMLAGQTFPNSPNGTLQAGVAPAQRNPNVGKGNSQERFTEVQTDRVTQKKRIFQDNDKTSDNWVDIQQINKVVWVDNVTGENIVWSR